MVIDIQSQGDRAAVGRGSEYLIEVQLNGNPGICVSGVSQMDVSVTSEVSWQTKLFKLHGMSLVLSTVGSFCMLFVFCHRINYSKTRAFSVSSGSYFLPLKSIVVGNFV